MSKGHRDNASPPSLSLLANGYYRYTVSENEGDIRQTMVRAGKVYCILVVYLTLNYTKDTRHYSRKKSASNLIIVN